VEGKIRVVMQHGKLTDDTYILDFGFPFTTIQAFAVAVGLSYFRKGPDSRL